MCALNVAFRLTLASIFIAMSWRPHTLRRARLCFPARARAHGPAPPRARALCRWAVSGMRARARARPLAALRAARAAQTAKVQSARARFGVGPKSTSECIAIRVCLRMYSEDGSHPRARAPRAGTVWGTRAVERTRSFSFGRAPPGDPGRAPRISRQNLYHRSCGFGGHTEFLHVF